MNQPFFAAKNTWCDIESWMLSPSLGRVIGEVGGQLMDGSDLANVAVAWRDNENG
jgi:hypothetical protein